MGNKLVLSDCLEYLDLLGLSVKLVLMGCNLIPEPSILSIEIDVFLSDLSMNCLLLDLNHLLCDGLDVFSDSHQENIDAVYEVLARFVGALN